MYKSILSKYLASILKVWDREFSFKYKVEGQTTGSATKFISMSELVTHSSFIEVDDYLFMSL